MTSPDTLVSALPEDDEKLIERFRRYAEIQDDMETRRLGRPATNNWAEGFREAATRIETLSREIERAKLDGRYEERAEVVAWIRRAVVSAWEDRSEGKLFSDLATDIENEEHVSLTTGSGAGHDTGLE